MKSLYPRIALAYASVLLCLVSRAFGAPAAESIALLQSSSVENGSIGFDTDDDLHYWLRRKDGWFWYIDPAPEP